MAEYAELVGRLRDGRGDMRTFELAAADAIEKLEAERDEANKWRRIWKERALKRQIQLAQARADTLEEIAELFDVTQTPAGLNALSKALANHIRTLKEAGR